MDEKDKEMEKEIINDFEKLFSERVKIKQKNKVNEDGKTKTSLDLVLTKNPMPDYYKTLELEELLINSGFIIEYTSTGIIGRVYEGKKEIIKGRATSYRITIGNFPKKHIKLRTSGPTIDFGTEQLKNIIYLYVKDLYRQKNI